MRKSFGLFRKHYELLSKDGCGKYWMSDYEQYSFFEALAGGTAIVWCSYNDHMYSNKYFSIKNNFCKSCFYATCDNKCYLYFRIKTGPFLVYVLNIDTK